MNNKTYPILIYIFCVLIAGISFAIKTGDISKTIGIMFAVAIAGLLPFQFFTDAANDKKKDGCNIGCAVFLLILFIVFVICL